MKIISHKTKLVTKNDDLFAVIADAIPELPEKSVVTIASKIISTTQANVVPITDAPEEKTQKHALVRQEADKYLEPDKSKYNLMITIKENVIAVNAGLDESNTADGYLLWPKDLQKTTNEIWQFLREHYGVQDVGVIVTDSRTIPLKWGVIGAAISYCGFKPLHSYIGTADLFGRELKMEQLSVLECIASCSVLEMGEGDEQTPLAVVTDIPKIVFQDHAPTQQELGELNIDIEDDVYAPFLNAVEWKKGKKE